MIESIEYNDDGYKPLIDFESWRVAILNNNVNMKISDLEFMERHMKTDEVFVLLQGQASLIQGEEAEQPKNLKLFEMKKNIYYNVKKATWHTVLMKKNTKILIVENKNTSKGNSEYFNFTNLMLESLDKGELL